MYISRSICLTGEVTTTRAHRRHGVNAQAVHLEKLYLDVVPELEGCRLRVEYVGDGLAGSRATQRLSDRGSEGGCRSYGGRAGAADERPDGGFHASCMCIYTMYLWLFSCPITTYMICYIM